MILKSRHGTIEVTKRNNVTSPSIDRGHECGVRALRNVSGTKRRKIKKGTNVTSGSEANAKKMPIPVRDVYIGTAN